MSNGMPQLDFVTYPSQFFWCCIVFIILYFLVHYSSKLIAKVIDNRSDIIDNKISDAQKMQQELQDLQKKYDMAIKDAEQKAADMIEDTVKTMKQRKNNHIDGIKKDIKIRIKQSEGDFQKVVDGIKPDLSKLIHEIALLYLGNVKKEDNLDEYRENLLTIVNNKLG